MNRFRFASIFLILMALILVTQGCFKHAVEVRAPLPDIIWPKPPDIPRIRFIDSFSGPEDLNIREGTIKKFFRYFKGVEKKSVVSPYGIAKDRDGRLFIVDTFCRCVHVFDKGNNSYYTFPENETSFVSPIDIAIDSRGNIYVSDSEDAVIKVFRNSGKKYVREIGRAFLKRPTGIAVNEKTHELLVIDTLNSEIIRYDLDSYVVKKITGRDGFEAGQFHYPTNIFITGDGNVFISDSLNSRIQIFSPELKFVRAFGQLGDGPGYFARPKGVAVDSDGNIYVVDAMFDNVQVFNSKGKLLMAFGGPGHGYGEFWLPSGIYIDADDRIYVSDSYNKRVQVFQYMKESDLLTR